MKTFEGQLLIWSSLTLALIQSYNVEGQFQYFGYIMWGICIMVFGFSIFFNYKK